MTESGFKFTYATMFNPPEELHQRFDAEMTRIKASLGKEYGMMIQGKDYLTKEKFEDIYPADTRQVLGVFQKGVASDAAKAVEAAHAAFPGWSHTPWRERVRLLRKASDILDRRLYEISAVVTLEVGKNRNEALGDVAEAADLIRYACNSMEANDGYIRAMGKDPLVGFDAQNFSVLRPYGVWLIISPFNFPAALTGGPAGAALVAGNTIVMKPASDTPWTTRLIAESFREAGIPDGVFNYVTGGGATLGQALIDHPLVRGITFTGSFEVGMSIGRSFSTGKYVRPAILEMGGKNPTIVSRNANLEDAALGIVRSAFGLQGQKCSACSRIYAEKPVYEALISRMLDLNSHLLIGDPTDRQIYNGPVINRKSYQDYQDFCGQIRNAGKILSGGNILTEGNYQHGYYCTNTIAVDVPQDHPLWKQEMFVPITMVAPVESLEEAMQAANDVSYGLTAGFYGTAEESEWFFDRIEAGVAYANRPQGSTTGAWPGFQPFGGWKGSGSSGKNAGGLYYLPLYMHEQIRTTIKHA